MTHTTGRLQWMAINSLERIDKEGEAVWIALYVRKCSDCLELDNCDET